MLAMSAAAGGIEIVFRVLEDGNAVFPKIKLHDRRGDIAFNAIDTSPQAMRRPRGMSRL